MGHKFVQNRDCGYFPCHKGVKEEEFNCLFCYCPLYALKNKCGGCYCYLKSGVKSCEKCTLPHQGEKGYDIILSKIGEIINLGKLNEEDKL